MKRQTNTTRLKELAKTGDVVHHKRDAKLAKDGGIRSFKLARGIKLEGAVKGKH
jgi:hypothetical protein